MGNNVMNPVYYFDAVNDEDAKSVIKKWCDSGIIPCGFYGIGREQDELHPDRYYAVMLYPRRNG